MASVQILWMNTPNLLYIVKVRNKTWKIDINFCTKCILKIVLKIAKFIIGCAKYKNPKITQNTAPYYRWIWALQVHWNHNTHLFFVCVWGGVGVVVCFLKLLEYVATYRCFGFLDFGGYFCVFTNSPLWEEHGSSYSLFILLCLLLLLLLLHTYNISETLTKPLMKISPWNCWDLNPRL